MRLEYTDSSHLFDDRLRLRQISQASAAPHTQHRPNNSIYCEEGLGVSISILYATAREGGFGTFHICSVVHDLHLISLVLVERSHARHSRK